MRRTIVIAALLAGCGGGGDGGDVDAGVDAAIEIDATVPSDAGSDAGVDAFVEPPGPITMSREAARSSLVVVQDVVADIPEAMRTDIDLVRIDVLSVRLDAVIGEKSVIEIAGVIGEKSVGTRSLGAAAIPALVVVRQLERAIIDVGELALEGFPDDAALTAALSQLRDDLAVLLTHVRERYGALVDATADVRLRVDTEYVAARRLSLVAPAGARVSVIVEGESEAVPQATLTVGCTAGAPAYRVFDEERGGMIADMVGTGTSVRGTFAVPAGRASSLRIEVNDTLGVTPSPTCTVQVSGTRDWRGTTIETDAVELDDLMLATATFETQLESVVDTMARLDGEVSPAAQSAFDLVREYLEEMVAESAAWRVLPVGFEEEEWDVMSLVLGSVLSSIGIVLEGRLGSRAEELTPIVTDLMEMRGANDDARVILDPTHMTTS
ncbi:hypothetical protein [Sandaracinus amylolyticus]|uniref:Uncharacterized protein n=1 Tax=Sandaracinus amylolyticus TaxID=927083 RepID=A0A0F6YLK3_9BACT|nr:hypothetical protein [Sandaracinus amylolyticus]AKF09560.1 hypothetical protein DB32_006709 [Sandaracinus amylolyticus]